MLEDVIKAFFEVAFDKVPFLGVLTSAGVAFATVYLMVRADRKRRQDEATAAALVPAVLPRDPWEAVERLTHSIRGVSTRQDAVMQKLEELADTARRVEQKITEAVNHRGFVDELTRENWRDLFDLVRGIDSKVDGIQLGRRK